jgi:hypothetical protein
MLATSPFTTLNSSFPALGVVAAQSWKSAMRGAYESVSKPAGGG